MAIQKLSVECKYLLIAIKSDEAIRKEEEKINMKKERMLECVCGKQIAFAFCGHKKFTVAIFTHNVNVS
jgi:hypothetical protein